MTTVRPTKPDTGQPAHTAPMTPYAIAVALFAAFVVGGILAKAAPLWTVAVAGLAIGAATFFVMIRYPHLGDRAARQPTIRH
ncbi:hypothetical protein [Krasilnikovia sp. M28-CT-15]|uniref:hypothetical protein n=1 Tax=Krasilnikovia sp. M28-CT-15 TaxID=3373540 RepID=UPI0038765DF8